MTLESSTNSIARRIEELTTENNLLKEKLHSGGWNAHVDQWMQQMLAAQKQIESAAISDKSSSSSEPGASGDLQGLQALLRAESEKCETLTTQVSNCLQNVIPQLEAQLAKRVSEITLINQRCIHLQEEVAAKDKLLKEWGDKVVEVNDAKDTIVTQLQKRIAELEAAAAVAMNTTPSERQEELLGGPSVAEVTTPLSPWKQQSSPTTNTFEAEKKRLEGLLRGAFGIEEREKERAEHDAAVKGYQYKIAGLEQQLGDLEKELEAMKAKEAATTPVNASAAGFDAFGEPSQSSLMHNVLKRKGVNPKDMLTFFFEGKDKIQELTEQRNALQASLQSAEQKLAVLRNQNEELNATRRTFLDNHNPTKSKRLQEDLKVLEEEVKKKDSMILTLKHELDAYRAKEQNTEVNPLGSMQAHIEEATNEIAAKRKELCDLNDKVGIITQETKVLQTSLDQKRKRLREFHNHALTLGAASFTMPRVADLLWFGEEEQQQQQVGQDGVVAVGDGDRQGKRVKTQELLNELQQLESKLKAVTLEKNELKEVYAMLQQRHTVLAAEFETTRTSLTNQLSVAQSENNKQSQKIKSLEHTVAMSEKTSHEQQQIIAKQQTAVDVMGKVLQQLQGGQMSALHALTLAHKDREVAVTERNYLRGHVNLQNALYEASSKLEADHCLIRRKLELEGMQQDMHAKSQLTTSALLKENDAMRSSLTDANERLAKAVLKQQVEEQKSTKLAEVVTVQQKRLRVLESEREEKTKNVSPQIKTIVNEVWKSQAAASSSATTTTTTTATPVTAESELTQAYNENVKKLNEILQGVVKELKDSAKGPQPIPDLQAPVLFLAK